MSLELSRPEAWSLFCEWTESPSLRKHVLAVEAAMRAYARRFGEDEELWGITGLLHDLDYERHPDLETGHPRIALKELEARGYPPELVRAVASHADFLGVSRDSPMEKTLFAVDELSGFVMACAYVRPTGIHGLTPKSVKKKMKTPAFAAAVNRDELREGAEELGVDFDEHLAFVIAALEARGRRARAQRLRGACLTPLRIVVLDGDETGQELLEQALRVLDPDVIGARRSSSSTSTCRSSAGARRRTPSCREAAAAMRDAGFGIKAATVTPEGKDDVGSPNRILREEVDGKVIIRTGRRIPGAVGPVSRRALPDLRRPDGGRRRLRRRAVARGRGGLPRRGRAADRADHARRLPRGGRVRFRAAERGGARASTAGRSGPSPPSTRACSRRRWTRRPSAIPTSPTSPC